MKAKGVARYFSGEDGLHREALFRIIKGSPVCNLLKIFWVFQKFIWSFKTELTLKVTYRTTLKCQFV